MTNAPLTSREGIDGFVELVRIYLGDLDDEARDDLTDGLAADVTDLVVEHGPDALPDPEDYADELRAAAGLPLRPRPVPQESGDRWAVVASCAEDLRPVWWVLRAQVCFWWIDFASSGDPGIERHVELVPWESNLGYLGLMAWALLVLGSVRLGRATRAGLTERQRMALLLLNVAVGVSAALLWGVLDSSFSITTDRVG